MSRFADFAWSLVLFSAALAAFYQPPPLPQAVLLLVFAGFAALAIGAILDFKASPSGAPVCRLTRRCSCRRHRALQSRLGRRLAASLPLEASSQAAGAAERRVRLAA